MEVVTKMSSRELTYATRQIWMGIPWLILFLFPPGYFTRSRAADSPSLLPPESTMESLYVPALAGTAMVVAVPAAFVIDDPAENCVVPAGANQTVFDAIPLLRILMELVPTGAAALAGNR